MLSLLFTASLVLSFMQLVVTAEIKKETMIRATNETEGTEETKTINSWCNKCTTC